MPRPPGTRSLPPARAAETRRPSFRKSPGQRGGASGKTTSELAVGPFHLGHAHDEVLVPIAMAKALGHLVLTVQLPVSDRIGACPVGHCDAQPVAAARAFDAQESGLLRS